MLKPNWYWKVTSSKENEQEKCDAWLSKNDSGNMHRKAIQAHDTKAHVLR